MKKRLLVFALMLVSLLVLLAVSISAAEIPEWTTITEVSGMPDKSAFGDDGKAGATSRVLMSDGVTYPAYYICKSSTSLGISFSDLNSKAGKAYTAADVVRIEIPKGTITISDAFKVANGYTALLTVVIPEGATTISEYAFKSVKDTASPIVSITIPSTVNSIGLQAFAYCSSLEELIIPEGVTEIPKEMARDTTSLKTLKLPSAIQTIGEAAFRSSHFSHDIIIPEGCTKIDQYAFKGSYITGVVVPSTLTDMGVDLFRDCPYLVSVHCKCPVIQEHMFRDCPELTTVVFENTIEIKQYAFNYSGTAKINSLVLPEGLTTIGTFAFPRLSITSLILPSTLTTIGASAFRASTTLTTVVVLGPCIGKEMFSECTSLSKLVLTDKFTEYGSSGLNNVSQTSFITYYTGTDYERIKTLFSATTRLSDAKYYSYEDYKNENYTYNKYMMIYDANLCEVAFDGIHQSPEAGPTCTSPAICPRCALVAENALGHEFDLEKGACVSNIVYESFGADGYYEIKCARCTECDNSTVARAIFVAKGYSTNPSKTGFATGFSINKDSLEAYEDFYNTKITFGIVIFNPYYLDENNLFVDGKIQCSRGVIQVTMDTVYSACNLSMNGFTNDFLSLELAFAGFAYVGDDTDNIQILQKEYNSTQESPVYSPMSRKITRGGTTLYTIRFETILTPAIMPNKSELDEYTKA